MIQRIQSLWLLLASLSVFLLFFFSVAVFNPTNESMVFGLTYYAYGLDYPQPFSDMLAGLYSPFLKYTIMAVVLVCILTPLYVIFNYKNRARQMQLSRLTILLNAALMVSFFLLSDLFAEKTSSTVDYSIGIFVPMGAIVFLLLAIRFIKKDDKLVRSADRIR